MANFLKNIRDGRSIITSNRLTNLAHWLLVHNLLLNCIMLLFYILEQNFLRATSTFLMNERLVGSSPIGISHTGPEVSGFPFLTKPGTRLKNRFCVFLDTQMSGYNLSSILEQVTTGSRVPENEEPIRVSRNGKSARISSPRSSSARVPKKRNPQSISGSRILRNGNPQQILGS